MQIVIAAIRVVPMPHNTHGRPIVAMSSSSASSASASRPFACNMIGSSGQSDPSSTSCCTHGKRGLRFALLQQRVAERPANHAECRRELEYLSVHRFGFCISTRRRNRPHPGPTGVRD